MDAIDTRPDSPAGSGREGPPAELAAAPAKGRFDFGWVPIKSLTPRHRPGILSHLLALGERDRYLRFGHMVSDAHIGRYVEQLDFERDEVFGIVNRRLDLVAMAHLACSGPGHANPAQAEFGVSVAKPVRGRGYGERLFDHAALHARNRGIATLLVHALSENTAMLRIVRNAGAHIERDGPESQAWVRLAPHSLASHVEALVEDGVADLDYRLKLKRNDHRGDVPVDVPPEL